MRYPDRKHFRLLARIHFWVMFFAFVSYLCFGFALGPDFFKKDIIQRLHVFADSIISVTATVLGGPAKPVVTATASCVSGAPRVTLDWGNDAATTTWDIDRDSLSLTTGLSASQYTDTAVIANTTYSYVVTAHGPMSPGSDVSDPVLATALDCPNILPAATVVIQTIGGTDVTTNRDGINLSKERPQVTGTTNIANAIVDIVLTNPSIQARFTANANGYFSWVSPIELNSGNHIVSVTIVDPNDSTRTATDSFVFHTKNNGNSTSDNNSSISRESLLNNVGTSLPVNQSEPAVLSPSPLSQSDFSVQVNGGAQFVFQGDVLKIVLLIDKPFPVGTVFRGFILDDHGKEVYDLGELTADSSGTHFDGVSKSEESQKKGVYSEAVTGIAHASGQLVLWTSRKIPLAFDSGMYRIRVDALYEGQVISREVLLEVRAWPLVQFGENAELTYPEVVSFAGTIFLVLLSSFILFLLLFVREYWLYLHHLRFVSERHLDRLGFISQKRKGVVQ